MKYHQGPRWHRPELTQLALCIHPSLSALPPAIPESPLLPHPVVSRPIMKLTPFRAAPPPKGMEVGAMVTGTQKTTQDTENTSPRRWDGPWQAQPSTTARSRTEGTWPKAVGSAGGEEGAEVRTALPRASAQRG